MPRNIREILRIMFPDGVLMTRSVPTRQDINGLLVPERIVPIDGNSGWPQASILEISIDQDRKRSVIEKLEP